MIDYDAELQLQHAFLRRAYGIRDTDHVVDIGCGAGLTTREAARMASAGSAFGIDISADMIAAARSKVAADEITNLTFGVGDAQVYPFAPDSFDVAISRFGTMFFADPAPAFGNIAHSLRPRGRLVMLVWQSYERNEWAVSIDQALYGDSPARARPEKAGAAFSLSNPALMRQILGEARFDGAKFVDVSAPVYYGPDPDAAFAFVSRFADVKERLSPVEADSDLLGDAGLACKRLRSLVEAHHTGRGVWFDARSWLVTAHRA